MNQARIADAIRTAFNGIASKQLDRFRNFAQSLTETDPDSRDESRGKADLRGEDRIVNDIERFLLISSSAAMPQRVVEESHENRTSIHELAVGSFLALNILDYRSRGLKSFSRRDPGIATLRAHCCLLQPRPCARVTCHLEVERDGVRIRRRFRGEELTGFSVQETAAGRKNSLVDRFTRQRMHKANLGSIAIRFHEIGVDDPFDHC